MIARSMKAKALVFSIFFVGIATGVLLGNFYMNRLVGSPAATDRTQVAQRAQRDINKFYDYLGLDEKQRAQMHKIGEETQHEFQELRKETQPRFQSIQEESRDKIRAILTDEQRKKYDEFRKNMDERRKNRNRDGNKNDREPKAERETRPN
jgi:Spy/CpxP family protein refolding chaperone